MTTWNFEPNIPIHISLTAYFDRRTQCIKRPIMNRFHRRNYAARGTYWPQSHPRMVLYTAFQNFPTERQNKGLYTRYPSHLIVPDRYGKVMASIIGCLNHIDYILPNGSYLLNRMYNLIARCALSEEKKRLNTEEVADLRLWLLFIERAGSQGIRINNITCNQTDVVT